MNKQGINGIGWCDYTWNPITGCLNNCPYCYARKIYKRFKNINSDFKPTMHYDRLCEPLGLKNPSRIFVCSTSDFWGKGVCQEWREEVYKTIKECPQHTFQILTKQPQKMTFSDALHMPNRIWRGVSVTKPIDKLRILQLTISIHEHNFISFEPLLEHMGTIRLDGISWVIIGGLSPKPVHKKEWIDNIVRQAKQKNIPVYIKDNAKYDKIIKQFPKI